MINELTKLMERFQHLSDYAETKLGVLIAFNTGVIVGITAIMKDLPFWLQCGLYGVILFLLLSLFFTFCGVFAKKNNNHTSSEDTTGKNYYFHGYVAKLNESAFLESFKRDYNLTSENAEQEKDIANQIVVLARNADRKFNYFNIALKLTICALLTPVGYLILHIYNNPN